MFIYLPVVVISILTNIITCESTSELPKELQHKATQRTSLKESTAVSDLTNNNSNMKTLLGLSNHVMSSETRKRTEQEDYRYRISATPSSHLTKLAKTLFLGFDPSFSKDYFEPFERRPRPVTLVSFRKRGLQPRQVLKVTDNIKPLEVAELQSPYNDVGSFWNDEPGELEIPNNN